MRNHEELFRQLGVNIAHYRHLKGWSQEELAVRANLSRGHLSHIEAPHVPGSFSIEMLFSICDALGIEPKVLFEFHNL